MNYDAIGPLPLTLQANGLPDTSAAAQSTFWAKVHKSHPKLSGACGVYVFAVAGKNGGAKPWYVGLTTKRTFAKECFGTHQVNYYSNSTAGRAYAKPQLFLLPKLTKSGRYAKPTKGKNGHPDISFLESYLIGVALSRNKNIHNKSQTKFLKNMFVPGILNAVVGKPNGHAVALKKVLGV